MKIMLDKSPAHIEKYSKRFDYPFWQLRTPLTCNRIADVPYGLDNGAFTEFKEKTWLRMLTDAEQVTPVFVAAPDCPFDAMRTLEMFQIYQRHLNELPACLVIQNGIENVQIPWSSLSAVFVGGDDAFKIKESTFRVLKVAQMLGKYIHLGRVNSEQRIIDYRQAEKDYNFSVGSVDGSGISRFDERLNVVLSAIRDLSPQTELSI